MIFSGVPFGMIVRSGVEIEKWSIWRIGGAIVLSRVITLFLYVQAGIFPHELNPAEYLFQWFPLH